MEIENGKELRHHRPNWAQGLATGAQPTLPRLTTDAQAWRGVVTALSPHAR
jgi:hypothetical protein